MSEFIPAFVLGAAPFAADACGQRIGGGLRRFRGDRRLCDGLLLGACGNSSQQSQRGRWQDPTR
jgi:hypothetical protein